MAIAFGWGFFSGCALLLGALLACTLPIGRRALGAIMAFGVGVLVSAVSFELVEKAGAATDGDWVIAVGMLLGAFTFFWGDTLIDRAGRSAWQDSPTGREFERRRDPSRHRSRLHTGIGRHRPRPRLG